MITRYASSKGPMEIASMPGRYASNALAKLQRDRMDDSRDAEIDALSAHVAALAEAALEAGDAA